jgi:hypothetical protein
VLPATKLVASGLALEIDAALGLQAVRVVAAGAAVETDSALALAAVKLLAPGAALETDTALALALPFSGQVGLAAEVDTALGLSVAKLVPVGLAAELGAALALTASKQLTVGLATEFDTALSPFSSTTYIATGQAAETDAALGLQIVLGEPGPLVILVAVAPAVRISAEAEPQGADMFETRAILNRGGPADADVVTLTVTVRRRGVIVATYTYTGADISRDGTGRYSKLVPDDELGLYSCLWECIYAGEPEVTGRQVAYYSRRR